MSGIREVSCLRGCCDCFPACYRHDQSVAGGTRFDVTERLALLGELRLRGIERDFAGSTADFMGGLSWRW